MAIQRAADEIRRGQARRPSAASTALFRARRQALEGLIGQVEDLIEGGASDLPRPLRDSIVQVLAAIYGSAPAWLDGVDSPIPMLDHLFIAEGELRRGYYSDRRIDLDESA